MLNVWLQSESKGRVLFSSFRGKQRELPLTRWLLWCILLADGESQTDIALCSLSSLAGPSIDPLRRPTCLLLSCSSR